MECPEYLKPFVSASGELAELFGRAVRNFVREEGYCPPFVGVNEDAYGHAVLSQQGGCHDGSGLAVGQSDTGITLEEVFREACAALLTPATISIACAEHLHARLHSFSLGSPSEGAVLATAQGVEPAIANAIMAWMPLGRTHAQEAAPLLALSFTRLAAVSDLLLPHGRLVSTPETGEIRLFRVGDNGSQNRKSSRGSIVPAIPFGV